MSKVSFDPEVDYYEILGVDYTATSTEIAKGFRKNALKCHPDKVGADDLAAAELFLRLNKAYEILTDATVKPIYDNTIKAKLQKLKRYQELDESRRRMRDDLEARENAAKRRKTTDNEDTAQLHQEIERLRQQGLQRLRERQQRSVDFLHDQVLRTSISDVVDDVDRTIKLAWKKKKLEVSAADIEALFREFGSIESVLMGSKGSSCLITFKTLESAKSALASLDPKLDVFQKSWVKHDAGASEEASQEKPPLKAKSVSRDIPVTETFKSKSATAQLPSSRLNNNDYEDLIFAKIQAKNRAKEAANEKA